MSTSPKFLLYLHSSVIATLLCTLLITACADPVRDAIKTAEKFAAAKDFTEALRTLDRAPFKSPEEKQRIAEARVRVVRAQKAVYIDKVLSTTESEPQVPLAGPFHGLAWQQEYFTPDLALRYNRLAMKYNAPVERCIEEKQSNRMLLCSSPIAYVGSVAVVDDMVARAVSYAERGEAVGMHCVQYFILRFFHAHRGDPEHILKMTTELNAATDSLQRKLKLTNPEFDEQVRVARRACTPELVFGKI